MSSPLCAEKVNLAEQYAAVEQKILRELDPMTVKIFSTMWEHGPRNLLLVSRLTRIPFTSVYHRVQRVESKSGPVAYLVPRLSRIGLVRIVVLMSARLGCEEVLSNALAAPNLWSAVERCEGAFTHSSVHSVPKPFFERFTSYLQAISQAGLATAARIVPTGDFVPNFPAFRYCDLARREWTFPWDEWFKEVLSAESSSPLLDPPSYETNADKTDLFIVRKLQVNARRSYAELASMLGISLYGVRYHFERKLTPKGIVDRFQFNVVPYPKEVSAVHEIMLEFGDAQSMNKFVSTVPSLFFVIGFAKVLGRSAILLRTYILESQLPRLFLFFSELAKENLLRSYSAIRKDIRSRRTQTISDELFDKEKGWIIDCDRCERELKDHRGIAA